MLDDEEDSTLHTWLAFLTYNNLFGTPNQAHIPTWETIEGAHDNPTDFAHDTVASALAQISDAVSPATVDLVTRHFREMYVSPCHLLNAQEADILTNSLPTARAQGTASCTTSPP